MLGVIHVYTYDVGMVKRKRTVERRNANPGPESQKNIETV